MNQRLDALPMMEMTSSNQWPQRFNSYDPHNETTSAFSQPFVLSSYNCIFNREIILSQICKLLDHDQHQWIMTKIKLFLEFNQYTSLLSLPKIDLKPTAPFVEKYFYFLQYKQLFEDVVPVNFFIDTDLRGGMPFWLRLHYYLLRNFS